MPLRFAAVTALTLFTGVVALARTDDVLNLFLPASQAGEGPLLAGLDSQALTGSARHRLATLDAAALDALTQDAGLSAALALFNDANFLAQVERVTPAATGGTIVTGALVNEMEARFTFIIRDQQLTGVIRTASRTFQIMPAGLAASDHLLMEIDPSTLPTCGLRPGSEPLPPIDAAPQPARAAAETYGSAPVVDVLVLYTPAARQSAGGTAAMRSFVELAVADTNEAYQFSQVNHRIRLVHIAETNYQETGGAGTELQRLANQTDGFMDEAHALRNQHGADLVSLITEELGACGVAYLLPSSRFPDFPNLAQSQGFSVVARSCAVGNLTFAHELGHNFGCQHDRANAGSPSLFEYEYGYRAPGSAFRTIMAYAPGPRIQRFSNPDITFSGQPCGGPSGSVNYTHNALVHNNTAAFVGEYRQAVDADCNTNGIPDIQDLASGFSVDCTGNLIPDECDIAAGRVPDCNANGVPDGCDLSAGAPDCNNNQIPDTCDIAAGLALDCNANGVPDGCDLVSLDSSDCDANLVPDECDLAANPSQDCNSNGLLDFCDTDPTFIATSAPQGPIGVGQSQQFAFDSPVTALGPVTVEISARGDLNTASEFLTLSLNGQVLGNVFVNGFADCAPDAETDQLQLAAEDFNTLVGSGPATVLLTPSAGVNPDLCTPPSSAAVALRYPAVPAFADADGDRVPDVCQTSLLGDMNCNGTVNVSDIAGFVLAITDPAGYAAQFPDCNINNADINQNGSANVGDIGGFVALVTGG